MGLLNRMKDSVSSAGIGVGQKFSCTAETVKLNNRIRSNEKEIEKLIFQIGQRCLELHIDDSDSEYEVLFAEIRHYQAENERHRAEIQRLSEEEQEQARQRQLEMQKRQEQREQERREREAQRQQQALLKQQEEQLRQKEMQESLDQATRVCPKCGERNYLDAKFCVYCGNPFVNGNGQQEETRQEAPQVQSETTQ